jgi:hypothetical protein
MGRSKVEDGIDLINDWSRIERLILEMREVGCKHDEIDADMLTFLHRHAHVLHAVVGEIRTNMLKCEEQRRRSLGA